MARRGTRLGRGDDTKYVIYTGGIETLNNISGGTREVVTGLTTVNSFVGTVHRTPTAGVTKAIACRIINITGGTVRLGFYDVGSGASLANNKSGVSLRWMATGSPN